MDHKKGKAASGGISSGDGGGQMRLEGFADLFESEQITAFEAAQAKAVG